MPGTKTQSFRDRASLIEAYEQKIGKPVWLHTNSGREVFTKLDRGHFGGFECGYLTGFTLVSKNGRRGITYEIDQQPQEDTV